jgi:hypothetical protein
MDDKQRQRHLEFFRAPLDTYGWSMDVAGVSLSHAATTGETRIGVLFQPPGEPPELSLHLFLSPADAVFLRDGIDEVLKVYRSRQNGAN